MLQRTSESKTKRLSKYLTNTAKVLQKKLQPKDEAKNKKRQSQAAILQMAEQAAKRAEEKAKKKAEQVPQARTKGEARHVDTRVNNVDLEKYNQK